MLGFEFDNNSEPFSVYNGCNAIACFIFQFIEVPVTSHVGYIIYTIACGVIAFLCCGTTIFFDFRDPKSSSNKQPQKVRNTIDLKGLLDGEDNNASVLTLDKSEHDFNRYIY